MTIEAAVVAIAKAHELRHRKDLPAVGLDIPATITALPEDVDKTTMPADVPGALQCDNYANQPGYAGPCPGNTHTYAFTLYAVDVASLGLNAAQVSVDEVEAAAQAVALAEATLSASFTP